MAIYYIRKIISLWPKTLFNRFMLIILLPFILNLAIISYVFFERHWASVNYYMRSSLINEIKLIIDAHNMKDSKYIEQISHFLNIQYKFLPDQVINTKNKRLNTELQELYLFLSSEINLPCIVKYSRKDTYIKIIIQLENGLLELTSSRKRILSPTINMFIWWLVISTLILLGIALLFLKNQIRSILSLAEAAKNFGKKNYLFKPSGPEEIRKAGFAFLEMKASIEDDMNRRTQMLAMISHDLRTPLTRIKLSLSLLEESEEIKEIQTEVNEMTHIIDSYLDFAKGDYLIDNKQKINLFKFISNIIPHYKEKIEIISRNKNLSCLIEPHSFKRAIINVLDNAARYAQKIIITIKIKNKNIIIDFEDNGCGIDIEDREQVFKPFHRLDKARNFNAPNVGLGLSITREILYAHGGDIELSASEKLGGLKLSFYLLK